MDGILHRVSMVVKGEKAVMRNRFLQYGITHIYGTAHFTGEEGAVQVTAAPAAALPQSDEEAALSAGVPKARVDVEPYTKPFTAEKFLVAVGTMPARRPDFAFDGTHIIDSDDLLSGSMHRVPRELIVVGAGVIGMEYASMFNVIPGTRVTVLDGRPDVLTFADREIIQSLEYEMRQKGARFLLGEEVLSAKREGEHVYATLASGKVLRGDCLLYTVGRQGNTGGLGLEKVGLEPNKRGLLTVNDNYQTPVPWIYAAGDCIGFPALASTSSQQGRQAAQHMWDPDSEAKAAFSGFPYGIYTIPEISMVGYTEHQLTADKVPYEMGVARYDELAKGQMMGGSNGMLKILFHAETLKILGVHCLGENATEIVHVGQLAMDMGLDMHYFTETVFNYPTFVEAYRSAAFNGLKRLALAGYADHHNDLDSHAINLAGHAHAPGQSASASSATAGEAASSEPTPAAADGEGSDRHAANGANTEKVA
jgi:NAD(P) transhydrogenase